MRPVIGITCSRLVGGNWGTYSPGHFMDYTYDAYSRAILSCGGAPLLVPIAQNASSIDRITGLIDGLLLTGGPDINPRFYKEPPLAGLGELDDDLDITEFAVASRAMERDLPILAVCRGIQVLNVSLGGTLFQDLASQVEDSIRHFQLADKGTFSHTVDIVEDTMLHRIFGEKRLMVNSKHHQAIKDLAPQFTVGATAPDGIVESIELPDKRFVLGVQWHPEGTWHKDTKSKSLFSAFIEAAGSRS